jgi:hypothetical protein
MITAFRELCKTHLREIDVPFVVKRFVDLALRMPHEGRVIRPSLVFLGECVSAGACGLQAAAPIFELLSLFFEWFTSPSFDRLAALATAVCERGALWVEQFLSAVPAEALFQGLTQAPRCEMPEYCDLLAALCRSELGGRLALLARLGDAAAALQSAEADDRAAIAFCRFAEAVFAKVPGALDADVLGLLVVFLGGSFGLKVRAIGAIGAALRAVGVGLLDGWADADVAALLGALPPADAEDAGDAASVLEAMLARATGSPAFAAQLAVAGAGEVLAELCEGEWGADVAVALLAKIEQLH